jgi:hypothetical protein
VSLIWMYLTEVRKVNMMREREPEAAAAPTIEQGAAHAGAAAR